MDKDFEVAKSSKRQKRIDFLIKTPSYQTEVNFLAENMVFLNKDHHYKKGSYIQTYGIEWAISFAELPEGKVILGSGKNKILLAGKTLIFHKPFSILEFEVLENCQISWGFVGSVLPCPVKIDQSKCLTNAKLEFPFSQENVINMLNSLLMGNPLTEERTSSPIAIRVKEHIDANYQNDLKITEVAKVLNISRVVMTRAFSQAYGLSPVEYRTRLRIHAALVYMRQGLSITDALYLVGFSNPSLFINNFKSYLNATPHQYKSKTRV